jgi:hypothetical protein
MKSRLTTLLFASALAAGLLIPTMMSSEASATARAATATAAPTLNLPYDGTDPSSTGCANTAQVVQSNVSSYGTLQLRWSTACKTNWGRFVANSNIGIVAVYVYREADSKFCGDQAGTGCNGAWYNTPATIYSNQLYGCNYRTYAEVEIYNNGHPVYEFTPDAGGC